MRYFYRDYSDKLSGSSATWPQYRVSDDAPIPTQAVRGTGIRDGIKGSI